MDPRATDPNSTLPNMLTTADGSNLSRTLDESVLRITNSGPIRKFADTALSNKGMVRTFLNQTSGRALETNDSLLDTMNLLVAPN